MNVANAVDRFTRQLSASGKSGHTQAAYRRDLEGLGRWLKVPFSGKVGSPSRKTERELKQIDKKKHK